MIERKGKNTIEKKMTKSYQRRKKLKITIKHDLTCESELRKE